MKVKYRVPATSANLGPGFDSLGLAIELFNYLEMEEIEQGLRITITGEGAGELPTNKSNLVFRAAMAVFKKANKYPSGLRIIQHNEIPLSRGLGSSSAAIVGGVLAANHLIGNPLSIVELLEIATKLEGHPDNVAPAFFGGFVASCLAENSVKYITAHPDNEFQIVLAIPDFQLKTKASRSCLPKEVPLKDVVFNISRVACLVGALMKSEFHHLSWATEDRLHQQYRSSLIPGLQEVIQAAKRAGAIASVLSGAGPTMLALSEKDPENVGEAMRLAFKRFGVEAKIVCTKICNNGAKTIDSFS